MAPNTQHRFTKGDWVRVARPISGNTDLQDQVLEVVEVVGKSAVLKERGKRRVVGVEQLEPIQQVREWQIGDRVEGENPEGKTLRGEIAAIGDRWLRIGPSPKDAVAVATARLLESIPHSDASESAITTVEAEVVPAEPAARLAQLEDEIRASLTQIEEGRSRLWAAVAAVKNEELWREAGHDNFVSYCKERWGWEKSNAYDNAIAGEVYQSLVLAGTAEEEIPKSLFAMRELARVEPEQRAEVVKKAAASTGGPPTAKAIKAAAAPVEEEEEFSDASESETEPTCLDASGQPIAVDDVVLTAADRELLGQVTDIEPDDFLPITVRTAGGITRVKAESLLVAPQEMVDSLIEQAKRKASEPGGDQSATENPAPVVEAPRGAWKVGDVVVDEYRPYSPMAIAKLSDTQACCWTQLDEMWIGWERLRPYDGPAEACSLEGIVRYRLKELVKVTSADEVAELLEELWDKEAAND